MLFVPPKNITTSRLEKEREEERLNIFLGMIRRMMMSGIEEGKGREFDKISIGEFRLFSITFLVIYLVICLQLAFKVHKQK